MLTECDTRRHDFEWSAEGVLGDGMAGDEAIAAFLATAPDLDDDGVAPTRRAMRQQRRRDRSNAKAARRRDRKEVRRRPRASRIVSRVRSSVDVKRLPRRLFVVALIISGMLVWLDGDRSDSERGGTNEVAASEMAQSSAVIPLVRPDGTEIVLTVDDDELATLDASVLPFLPEGFTYQVWGATATESVSLAVLGTDPGVVTFHLPPTVGSLAITVEAEGGAAAPTPPAVAFGTVPTEG